jgi:quercetin dioxygenase-like cupin family protein
MLLAAALGVGLAGAARAQEPPPDPTHIPFTLPADIQWRGSAESGQYQARLFGDPSKPGPYGLLIKWMPGKYSHPHFHSKDRWAYVVSGTWWVSSSTHFDPSKTYPLPAGTFATDLANTVHWDGAKAGGEPAVLELVGMGPVTTTQVDEKGEPILPTGANR